MIAAKHPIDHEAPGCGEIATVTTVSRQDMIRGVYDCQSEGQLPAAI